jgi:hypothetical protein
LDTLLQIDFAKCLRKQGMNPTETPSNKSPDSAIIAN